MKHFLARDRRRPCRGVRREAAPMRRRSTRSSNAASLFAARILVLRVSRCRTRKAIGQGSTSIIVEPSPRPCSATPKKVKFMPLDATSRFESLKSGAVDVLVRNTTWTLSRDSTPGPRFRGDQLL